MHFPPNVIIHVGDPAVFVCHVGMKPEYHITTEKAYEGVITKSSYGLTEIEITNDAGEKVIHEAMYGSFNGGMTTITTQVIGEPLRKRKLAFVDRLVAEANEAHAATLAKLNTKRETILQEG